MIHPGATSAPVRIAVINFKFNIFNQINYFERLLYEYLKCVSWHTLRKVFKRFTSVRFVEIISEHPENRNMYYTQYYIVIIRAAFRLIKNRPGFYYVIIILPSYRYRNLYLIRYLLLLHYGFIMPGRFRVYTPLPQTRRIRF